MISKQNQNEQTTKPQLSSGRYFNHRIFNHRLLTKHLAMIRTILSLIKFFLIAVPLACFVYAVLFLIVKFREDAESQRMD